MNIIGTNPQEKKITYEGDIWIPSGVMYIITISSIFCVSRFSQNGGNKKPMLYAFKKYLMHLATITTP
jgi:hypothetical protein